MKGIVFVEFLNMLEERYSYELVDEVISNSDLESSGAYTSVGTYSHEEMIKLVESLSEKVHLPASDLVRAFGSYLLQRFAEIYPNFFEEVSGTFEFLESVEHHIHDEVLKLYPEAELPMIRCSRPPDGTLLVHYQSSRPFADLAAGLIEATATHFGESIAVHRRDLEGAAGTEAEFTLKHA